MLPPRLRRESITQRPKGSDNETPPRLSSGIPTVLALAARAAVALHQPAPLGHRQSDLPPYPQSNELSGNRAVNRWTFSDVETAASGELVQTAALTSYAELSRSQKAPNPGHSLLDYTSRARSSAEGLDLNYVCFEDNVLVSLLPHLVRLLPDAPGPVTTRSHRRPALRSHPPPDPHTHRPDAIPAAATTGTSSGAAARSLRTLAPDPGGELLEHLTIANLPAPRR
jgi:hypothetical protein